MAPVPPVSHPGAVDPTSGRYWPVARTVDRPRAAAGSAATLVPAFLGRGMRGGRAPRASDAGPRSRICGAECAASDGGTTRVPTGGTSLRLHAEFVVTAILPLCLDAPATVVDRGSSSVRIVPGSHSRGALRRVCSSKQTAPAVIRSVAARWIAVSRRSGGDGAAGRGAAAAASPRAPRPRQSRAAHRCRHAGRDTWTDLLAGRIAIGSRWSGIVALEFRGSCDRAPGRPGVS